MLIAAWQVLVELAPWMLLGMAIAGTLHLLLPNGLIHRRLRGRGGVVQAVALGVPLPLCSCSVIPAALGLKKDGADDGAALGFLISTPQTGVDSFLLSATFLGWPFALFKVISAALMGIVGGWWAEGPRAGRIDALPVGTVSQPAKRGIREGFDHSLEVVRSVWIWLLVGVIVSAAIQTWLPPMAFERLGSMGTLPSALAALVISLPLYVCAVGSVPIAAALVADGLPPGAALVFLMAGPATNVATMGAIHRTFGRRVLGVYLVTIVVGSVVAAVVFDSLLPTAFQMARTGEHEHMTGWWAAVSSVSAVILLAIFAWFAWQDVTGWWHARLRRAEWRRRHWAASAAPEGEQTAEAATPGAFDTSMEFQPGYRVEVRGMSCNNCVHRLEAALRATDGVSSVHVLLDPGEAVVHGTIDEVRLKARIRESGFEPVGAAALAQGEE